MTLIRFSTEIPQKWVKAWYLELIKLLQFDFEQTNESNSECHKTWNIEAIELVSVCIKKMQNLPSHNDDAVLVVWMTLFNASSSDFSMNDASRPPIDPQATSAYIRGHSNIQMLKSVKFLEHFGSPPPHWPPPCVILWHSVLHFQPPNTYF